jgi:hypothetical protein
MYSTYGRTWDDRLDDLRRYHEEHGTYNVPRNSSLGEWLHDQRTLYGKRDTRFMERRAPRMVAIVYVFDVRENTTASVSWEDRFRQLAEYKQRHGNLDVPSSTAIDGDGDGDGDGDDKVELEENQNRFYKWVSRLHNEHRAFEKGTSS